MTPTTRLALIGAALLVAILAGGMLVLGGGGRSTATPTAIPSSGPLSVPSASPLALQAGTAALSAGSYAAHLEAGNLAFSLPDGWASPQVTRQDFSLQRTAGPTADTVRVFFDMRRAARNALCTEAPEPKVAGTAQAIADDLASDPSLQVARQTPVTVGGIPAQVLDVQLAAGVTRTCPFSNGQPSVPLVVDAIPGPGAFWGVGPGERIRLILLDVSNGHNIVVAIDSGAGTSFDALTAAAMPIVQSFAFDTTAPAPVDIPCEDDLPGCAGPLAAGSHSSEAFQPTLTFTTPAGWKNVVDTPTIFKLDPASTADPYLIVWSNVAIPDGCGPAILKGSGTKVTDFVNFVSHHPGIQVLSNSQGLVGRWTARILDLRIKDTYTGGCSGVPGNAVDFILDTDPLSGVQPYGVGSGGRMHVAFVDVNGTTVIIQAYGPDTDAGLAAAIATVQPLIDSFQFAPAN